MPKFLEMLAMLGMLGMHARPSPATRPPVTRRTRPSPAERTSPSGKISVAPCVKKMSRNDPK